jgi:hypothetical protein
VIAYKGGYSNKLAISDDRGTTTKLVSFMADDTTQVAKLRFTGGHLYICTESAVLWRSK